MKRIVFFIFIVLYSCLVFGQLKQPELKFHTLSPKGGLSYDGVIDIQQDGKGLMWILFENNIFRFDGYKYKSFKTDFLNNVNSVTNYYNNISADKSGDLYVSTTKGIYKFKYTEDRFVEVLQIPNNYIYIDNDNTFWISTTDGLAYIKGVNQLVYPSFKGRELPLNKQLFCENEKDLYVFSHFGHVFHYNRSDKTIDDVINIHDELNGAYVIDAQIHERRLWMLTSDFSLFKIDLITNEISCQYCNVDLNDIGVKSLYISDEENLWIGTMNGLYIHDPHYSTTYHYEHNQYEAFSIPHSSIWKIYEDSQQNVWMGTYMGSVAYVNPYDKKIFETYSLSPNGLKKLPVSGFSEDETNLWISTEGGGINILNKDSDSFSYLQHNVNKNSLSSDYTKTSVTDTDGNIWISTFRGGLNCYNPYSNKFTHYKHDPKDKNSLLSNNIRKVVLEPDSGLWINYLMHTAAFSFFSFKDKTIKHFSFEENDRMIISNDYIYDMYRGDNNMIWFITAYSLYSFDIHSNSYVKHQIPANGKAIASTLCLNIYEEIWIGTFSNELIKFDTKSSTFQSFPNILQSDIAEIYSINHSDDKIWLGTNDGLYLFDTKTNSAAVFKESDGTQGNVYYPLATMKGADGLLYFGGAGGFTIVNPRNVSYNPISPEAMITDFFVDNKSVLGKSDNKINTDFISTTSDLILNHKQQNFGFKISSTNYLNADKNQFKYRLRKFDDQWMDVDASNRAIHYSKIPPGTYFFEFQTANNDGVWGEISSVKIVRRQTPWLSTDAVIFYILVFTSLLVYFISLYSNRRRLELQLYKVRMEKEKRKEIHKNQLQFFTNISHDLKTPLSLIMATVNRMREEGMKEYYYNILNSNSQRLMRLLTDILDYRKVQDSMMKLEISIDNINDFVRKISYDFTEAASVKHLDFQIITDDATLSNVPFDKKIIEKIIMNLLYNSFTYTTKGGYVKITVRTKAFESKYKTKHSIVENSDLHVDSSFQLVVSDSGIGISKEAITKVFERFYRVDSKNTTGSGIGLALVKDLVSIQRGSITIYSEENSGTDIVVKLSKLPEYYQPEEMQKKDSVILINESSSDLSIPKSEKTVNVEVVDHIKLADNKPKDKTILIAEDNVDLRNIIKISLEEEYEVVGFDNGGPALEYLKENNVDLIISDIMMPEVDGITFCKSIKNNVVTSHIPFVLLTAKSGLDSMLEGTESGADLYFEKPLDLSLLKASLSNVFKQQELLREHYAKNYFADLSELTTNKEDTKFLTDVGNIINTRIDQSDLDVNTIASEMMMSRSTLYSKIKALTGKSIVEFILGLRLRRSAKLLAESNISVQEAMFAVGIESRSYFTKAFKNEFGLPPSKFAKEYKGGNMKE